jgi:hypothetical protein
MPACSIIVVRGQKRHEVTVYGGQSLIGTPDSSTMDDRRRFTLLWRALKRLAKRERFGDVCS